MSPEILNGLKPKGFTEATINRTPQHLKLYHFFIERDMSYKISKTEYRNTKNK